MIEGYQKRTTQTALPGTRTRIERKKSGKHVITGYGAVFYREGVPGTEYSLTLDGSVVERIDPNAFDRVLRERQDVRGLFNHDSNFVLGRTASQTMRLKVDSIGLRYEIDIDPESPFSAHVLSAVRRKDVSGSSFGFVPSRVRWEESIDGRDVRYLEDFYLLHDVGPVTYPAYTGATAAIGGGAELDRKREADRVNVRLRLLEIDELSGASK